jgi:hypothetical protein
MFCRRPLIVASVIAVAAFSLLAAGCGGGSSPGVASVASTTTGVTATAQNGLVAYSACMRTNGVANFPDPTSSGGIPKQAVVSAFQAVGNSQADAAQNACRHLLGAGGSLSGKASRPIPAQDREDYLKAAACMRSHGFSGFPDPTFQNNNVTFNIPSSIDTSSSQFTSAKATCEKLIPAGLPDSSSSAS